MNRTRFLRRLRGQLRATRLIVPAGKAAGCLPRVDRYGMCAGVPRFQDQIRVLPASEWPNWIGRIQLAERVWDVLDQNGHGSCAAECVTGAITLLREVAGLERKKLNPWTMYQSTSGGRDRGSNIGTNLRRSAQVGILPQDYWPRSKGLWTRLPAGWERIATDYRAHEWFDIDSKAEFVSALLYGFPIVYGRRGHAICAVEWLDGDRVLYLNSWDEAWNGGGFGIDTWRSIASAIKNYGAYALRSVVDSGEAEPVLAGGRPLLPRHRRSVPAFNLGL